MNSRSVPQIRNTPLQRYLMTNAVAMGERTGGSRSQVCPLPLPRRTPLPLKSLLPGHWGDRRILDVILFWDTLSRVFTLWFRWMFIILRRMMYITPSPPLRRICLSYIFSLSVSTLSGCPSTQPFSPSVFVCDHYRHCQPRLLLEPGCTRATH